MGFKITDYPAKTAFDDGDLYDVSSYDGVSAYTSEKMTFTQLKNELNSSLSFSSIYDADGSLTSTRVVTLSASNYLSFEGGETTFKGESSADDGTYVSKFLNSSSGDVFLLKNNGRASLNGTIDNNTILKISNTAELYKTGLSVDTNGGTAIIANATAASGGNAIKGTVSGGNALALHGVANNATSFGVKGESSLGYGGQFTGGTAAIITVSGSGDIYTEGVIRYSEEPDPTAVANKGFTYCKDVSGVTELFFMRSDGTTIQLS